MGAFDLVSQGQRVSFVFFAALVSATAIGPMAMQLLVPSIPAIATHFDVSIGLASLNFSVSAVTLGISSLFFGPLSDRFGRRPVLLSGIAIFVVGTIIAGVAPSLWVVITGRVIQAVGGAAGMVIARTIVRDVYGPERSASMIGTLTVAMVAAPMIAIILGGVLTDFFGWRAIFLFAFLVTIPATVLTVVALKETRQVRARSGTALQEVVRGYSRLFRVPAFNGYVFQGAFAGGNFFAFMAAGPYLMVNVLDRSVSEFGAYFAIVTLVYMGANYAGGRLSQRVGIERMVMLGAAWSAVAAIGGLLWLSAFGLDVTMLFATSALISIGSGLAMPNVQAGALNAVPEYAGTASGAAAFLQTIMGAIFAQVVGSLLTDSANPLFAAMVVSAVIGLAFSILPSLFRHVPSAGESDVSPASEQSPAE